jgi:hypothetical protein
MLTFACWFTCTQVTLGIFIWRPEQSQTWIYLILVLRSVLAVITTASRPLWLTYKREGKGFILLPPNSECIESVEMVLQIPIATEYFYEFLDEFGSD